MVVRCAWCKRIIRDKARYGEKWDMEITDGICDDCLKKYFGIDRRRGACGSRGRSSIGSWR